jgi:hypothetical protein
VRFGWLPVIAVSVFLRVFLKNGTQPALVEPQFEPVLFRKFFDLGFPIF